MNQLNQIIIEGNIVRDAESKIVPSGKNLCAFTIAHNRSHKRADGSYEEATSYFDCEAWEKLAEVSAKKALKGETARVVGRLSQNRWTDAEGKIRSQVKIVCEHAEFLSHKKQGENTQATDTASTTSSDENMGTKPEETFEDEEAQSSNFDIPF